MKRIRVLFPYVEAGYGHIMPMKSIDETFRRKYGDKVDVISSDFFKETGDKHLIMYEQMLSRQVRLYNRFPAIGHLATAVCEFVGTDLSSFGAMRLVSPIARRRGIAHMEELEPDFVFSTHWATNYYAQFAKNKPYTVVYCPDAQLYKLFCFRSDLTLISMPYGYQIGLRKKQYSTSNLKLVPFLIRNEAFDVDSDKKEIRKKLGLPEDSFTVLLAEGGYGIGKMGRITEILSKEHIPLTIIPVCGTNSKLFSRLREIKPSDEVTLIPYAFAENMIELQAASDIFCGKSGNILAEATFFGNPCIVTHCANQIERNIADHYMNTVGNAFMQFSAKKAADMIKTFACERSKMEIYRKAAVDYQSNFGSETAADILWGRITETYPELLND